MHLDNHDPQNRRAVAHIVGQVQPRLPADGAKREFHRRGMRLAEIIAKAVIVAHETVRLVPVRRGNGPAIGIQQIQDRALRLGPQALQLGRYRIAPFARRSAQDGLDHGVVGQDGDNRALPVKDAFQRQGT